MPWRLRSRREPGQNSGCCLEFWEVDAAPVQRESATEQIHDLTLGQDVDQGSNLIQAHHGIDAARLDQRSREGLHVAADRPIYVVVRARRMRLL
jgi:hypothetical protein